MSTNNSFQAAVAEAKERARRQDEERAKQNGGVTERETESPLLSPTVPDLQPLRVSPDFARRRSDAQDSQAAEHVTPESVVTDERNGDNHETATVPARKQSTASNYLGLVPAKKRKRSEEQETSAAKQRRQSDGLEENGNTNRRPSRPHAPPKRAPRGPQGPASER